MTLPAAQVCELEVAEDQFVMINGTRLRYRRVGPRGGTPLLLLNGIGSSLEMWAPFAGRLQDDAGPGTGFDLIAMDLPGSGLSQAPMFPVTMLWFSDVVAKLIAHLELERVDLLGFSFGGAVAQQTAFDSPHLLRRLVLCATTPGLPALPGTPMAMLAVATPLRYLDHVAGMVLVPWLAGGRTLRDHALLVEEMTRRQLAPPGWWGYLLQLTAISWWTAQVFACRIRVPTLVLHGEEDPLCPAINARWLACLIPGAQFAPLARAGHLFLIDEPERAAAHVRDFLG